MAAPLMALADSCGGVCAFLNLPEGAIGTATIESKTNFMRGVREGTITARRVRCTGDARWPCSRPRSREPTARSSRR